MSEPPAPHPAISPEQLLDSLLDITLQIRDGTNVDEVLSIAVRECRSQLKADRVIVHRLVPQSTAVVLAESVGAEWTPMFGQQIANSCLSAAWINTYKQSPWREIVEVNALTDGTGYQQILAHFQVQANLIVPVLVQGDLWGLLIAHHCRNNHSWQRLEVQFLQQVALHLGARIELITNHQTAETTLHQYKQIISTTLQGIALIDRNYTYQVINPSYEHWNNKSSSEILGQSVPQLLGEAPFQEIKPYLDRCLTGEITSWKGWVAYRGVERRFIQATYTPYVESDGQVTGVVIHVHDQTDLKRVEETLAESEERFWQMASHIHEVFWITDIDFTHLLYISPAYEEIWGRDCASLYEQLQLFLEAVHPEDQARVSAAFAEHRQDGFSHEYRLVKPDGSIRWIWEQTFPIQDATGHPYRLVGISQDITPHKLAEANLRLSEERLRLAMDLSQLGRWDWNLVTGELDWSEQTFSIMGFAPDDPTYKSWYNRLPPEDLEMVESSITQAQEHRTYFHCEYRLHHPDGSIHWILARGKTLYDGAARPVRMIGIVMDISDRKQLEVALRNSEERYRQIVETATEGIWILDANNATTFINPCMSEMLGYSDREMMGKSLFDLMDEEGKAIAAHMLERRRQGIVEQFDFKLQHKDGSDVWTLISTRPLYDEAGCYAGALGMLADITQRKLSELALQQQTHREQALNRVFQAIRNSLDLDTVFATATTETAHLLNVERVSIVQYLLDRQCWQIVSSFRQSGLTDAVGLEIPDADNPIGHQLKQGMGVQVEDTNTITDDINRKVAQTLPGAWLLLPLMNQGIVWGCLFVNSAQQPFSWSAAQVSLVQAVVDQLAIAIQQASLYRQTQLELAERQRAESALQQLNLQLEQRVQERTQALQQQAEQEHLLRLSVQNIHQSLDIEETLTTVLSETRRTLQTDRVAIYQFSPDWSGRFIAESVGEGWIALVEEGIQTVWKDTYLQETQGGRYQNHEMLVVSDIYTAGLTQCHIETLEQFQVKAYATSPIFVDDQLWGLLATYQNRGSHEWQEWEVSLLEQISIQLAIALRQSHLYQAAQMQVKELEKLHQLKDEFLSTVSHELRSPLTNIKMAIEMVELRLLNQRIQDDRLAQYLKILKESVAKS